MQLTDEPSQRCYPLDNNLLCQNCHLKRRNLQHLDSPDQFLS